MNKPSPSVIARRFLSNKFVLGLLPARGLSVRLNWRAILQGLDIRQAIFWSVMIACVGLFSLIRLPFLSVYILIPVTIAAVAISLAMNQSRLREQARRLAEEALKQSNQDLRTIIDHTPAMIGYWDRDLKNRFGNRAYFEWFGTTQEHMHNRHIREIIGEERYAKNLPYIEAALRGESPVFERIISDRQNKTRHVLASYVPDMEGGEAKGFYAFINDITSLKEAQREQFMAQAKLQSIIDAASEFSIIATALDGTIEVFSAGAERMLGYRASELVGQATPTILHLPDEMEARRNELEAELGIPIAPFEIFTAKTRGGYADIHEWTYRRKDGSSLPVRLVATAMHDADGTVSGYVGIAKDISQQRQLQISLVKAKELAEAASHAKSEFVANMSHEIRTPLNAVLGMAHLLGTTPLSDEQKNYLEMIRISGNSLLGIINDILDFSKIEAGRIDILSEPFDLSDVLNVVANIMKINSGEKDLELALGIGVGVPPRLIGDALRVQQILVNLVSNAIKFTERGEVTLMVECDAPVEADDNWIILRLIVRDTGIGMDVEQQANVFSAFSQADTSTTRRFGGTGLGLAICKRLVTLMKGEIQLQSKSGVGSEFIVTLPMQIAGSGSSERNAATRKLNLLIIDGNSTSRDYLSQTIRSLDWHVDVVGSGAEGIRLALEKSNQQIPYDLVLLDWHIPGMDSATVMQAIRESANPSRTESHIGIMVSAFGRGKLIGDQRVMQADSIFVKPVTVDNLLAITGQGALNSVIELDRSLSVELHKWNHRIDGVHILLVEDNHLNQVVARGMLVQAGATVDVLDNGLKAIERLAGETHYDIILMDVQMPVMDGCTAARKIRQDLKLTVPILAMTAGVLASEHALCIQSGMNDFISKPIDVEQMFTTIVRYLPSRDALKPVTPDAQEELVVSPENQPNQIFNPDPVLQVGENDAAYRNNMVELIRRTVQQSPLLLSDAEQAWKSGNIKESAKILHSMRSSLGMLGAMQFSTAAVDIEKALHNEAFDLLPPLFDSAQSSLELTCQVAQLWLKKQEH